MAVRNAIYLPSQTDMALAAFWNVAEAPSTPWDAGSTVTFADGGPVTLTNVNALGAINLASFKVNPLCAVPMGEEGSPIYIYANSGSGLVDYNGKSALNYFRGGTTKTVKTFLYRPVVPSLGVISDMDISTNLIVGTNGTVRVLSSTTVVGTYVYGSGQCLIREHSSDECDDIRLSGRATLTLKRPLADDKNVYVPVGCTLIVDLTATSGSTVSAGDLTGGTGKVILCGGTVIVLNGNMTVDGISGRLDYSQAQRPLAITITETPDVTRVEGAVAVTVTATSIGPGATVIRQG